MKMTLAEFKLLKGKKRSKYNNQKTTYNGREYDSKKEAKRAWELDMLLKAGVLRSWTPQPSFKITYKGEHICTYRGDFRVRYSDGHEEIEDVKGVRTDVFILKKKLVKAFYGITIKEL